MKSKTYRELQIELDNVVAALQSDEVDLDKAIELHKKGTELLLAMKKHLDEAELKIKKLK